MSASDTTIRWKLLVEYDGSDYAGWQKQDGEPTIQASLEAAIKLFCGQDLTVHGAGRTDSGVHAFGQIAHVDLDYGGRALTGHDFAKAINAHLKDQRIAVLHAAPAEEGFHARFTAKNKLYHYRIIQRSSRPALERGYAWHLRKPLDLEAMRRAIVHFIGYHDFTTFRDSRCQAKSPMRSINRAEIHATTSNNYGGTEYVFEFEGKSFLHHQVRNMVGTLSLVGLGKWAPDDVKTALEAKDRTKGGPTAPAEGLYMVRVDYGE